MSIDLRRSSFFLYILLSLTLGGSAACMDADDHAELGTISASLVGQTPSGAIYRLRDAVIQVSGPGSPVVWNTEDDPNRTALSADVPVGEYSASLEPGWRLERVETSATTVEAVLVSANPVEFEVAAGQRTNLSFRFQVGTDVVDTTSGDYEITIDVEEIPARELFVASFFGAIHVFSTTANADAAPIRTIAGFETRLDTPVDLSIVGDEIMVVDVARRSVLFYPASASGDVDPTHWTWSGAGFLRAAAVFNDELYVAISLGEVHVYPHPSFDEPPTRSLRLGSSTSAIAIHDGELYVATSTGIHVYPIPPAGSPDFPSSTRTFGPSGLLWSDISFHGEEIFASVPGRIEVYPRGGSSAPLRTITDTTTQGFIANGIAAAGNALFVGNATSVMVYRADANGDTPPLRSIGGAAAIAPSDVALR